MAIKQKLDEEWERNRTADAVVELRAETESAYDNLLAHQAKINRIVEGSQFGAVDQELKVEIQTVRGIIDRAVTDMEAHLEFLKWTPPTRADGLAPNGGGRGRPSP